MKKLSILILSIFVLFTILGATNLKVGADGPLEPLTRSGSNVYYYGTTDQVEIPTTYYERDTEFRASWVATVYSLDITYSNETQFKADFNTIIDELLAANMNAMVFQVRSLNDAYFDSDFAPWGRYVTGTEGVDPGWDILTWMITECHANGIEFHAWLNPYRVANVSDSYTDPSDYLTTLDDENWAKQNPDKLLYANPSGSNIPVILNPGEPLVKQYIRDVVEEIITEYDVDGIHFDDYFYPSSGTPTSEDADLYNLYKEVGQSLDDWRRENVNDVVRGIKEDIDVYNSTSGESVKFGISPSGVWASSVDHPDGSNTRDGAHDSYYQQYADSKRWVEEEWLHYIAPQIYRDFHHDWVPYADIVDWWADVCRGTDVDLITGQSLYMDYFDNDEVSTQLLYNQKHPEIKGAIMYRHTYMNTTRFSPVVLNNWTTTPTNVWTPESVGITVSVDGESDGNVYIEDVSVSLSTESPDAIWYQLDGGDWIEYTLPFDVVGEGAHALYLKTIDGLGNESPLEGFDIPIQYFNLDVPVILITGSQIGDNYILGATISVTSTSEDIYIAINHGSVGEWELYTEPIVLDDIGNYYIRAKTTDSRGTDSDEENMSITVQEDCYDTPSILLEGTGSNNVYQSVTMTLTSDTEVSYKVNDGAWEVYTSPVLFDGEGIYEITYRNNDNCAIESTTSFTIDTTPPENATIIIDGDYDGTRYYTSETTITFTEIEQGATLMVRIHNGSMWSTWTEYSDPIEFIYTSNYYVQYQVIDDAENSSGVIEERIRLDLPLTENNVYVIRNGEIVTYYDSDIPIILPEYTEKTEEVRAVWVATVSNIDIPQHTSEEQYKNVIIEMLDTIEEHNFNVIFFQVRSMNDAFYDSSYAPWSRYLTGNEGEDPGWDVLGFIIEESHKRGIEFHAWLNPYRVSNGTGTIEEQIIYLDEENWARQNPDMLLQDNAGHLILNPGERQVQVFIRNVIQELINYYDVDGIHFDDYFYSYNGTPDSADEDLYNAKKDPGQSKADWRRENINTVVREVFELIEEYNTENGKTIEFGISPFGVWSSTEEGGSNVSPYTLQSYSAQYADTKRWVEEGWVHYITPQLYWEFNHGAAPFADLALWWAELCEENDVNLIIGHGFYRYTNDSWDDESELLEQLRFISQFDSVIGSTFFSYRTLNSTDPELVQAIDRLLEHYWTEYVTFPWESTVEKFVLVCDDGYHIEGEECVKDPLVCEDGYHVEGEECVIDPLVCPTGQHEQDGECVDDPIVCEDGYSEIDGECVKDVTPCPDGYETIPGGCREIKTTGCKANLQIGSIVIPIALLGLILVIIRKNQSHVNS